VGLLRYHAHLARTTPLEERRPRVDGAGHTLVLRAPVGVVAVIVPWNFPKPITMFKIAPALAAGCTVVLKPSPYTVLGAAELVAAAERAGLPAGVLNMVTGGEQVGAQLVSHPGVHKVAFTGSTRTGRTIAAACAELLRPVTLELSGRSAAIVLDDADAEQTAQGLANCSLLNNGQTCYLSTRILLPRARHDEIAERIAAMASSLPLGDPLDPATRVGPLVTAAHRDKVRSFVEAGTAGGARLLTAGRRPALPEDGYFVAPAVFADVPHDSPLAREEIFGPVLALTPYDDLDHAVALANDTPYGLGGTVWSPDVERAVEVARRIESGTVGVNFFDLDLGAPYGGVKDSGLGRELGPEGFAAYFTYKSIYLAAPAGTPA
jgi:acyl-CoA reductase-like NAD-dependent aldehyde dehydrogenase